MRESKRWGGPPARLIAKRRLGEPVHCDLLKIRNFGLPLTLFRHDWGLSFVVQHKSWEQSRPLAACGLLM